MDEKEKMFEPKFLSTDTPSVHHGTHVLTGNDCIELSVALEKMSSMGLQNDPRFNTLTSILYYVVKFAQQKAKLQIASELFTPEQKTRLLLQMKAVQVLNRGLHPSEPLQNLLKQFALPPGTYNPNLPPARQAELVKRVLENGSVDPPSALVDALMNSRPKISDIRLTEERSEIIAKSVDKRLKHLSELQAKRALPSLVREQAQIKLIALQTRVRHAVTQSIPTDIRDSGTFRNKKTIELEQRIREKELRKNKLNFDKAKRKERKDFLTAVLAHQRNFVNVHRENKRQLKKLVLGAQKLYESVEKQAQDEEKQTEKDRLNALKNQNEEEYIRLLKKTKNERLHTLMKQTEEYMSSLGATIQKEQRHAEQEKARKAAEVKKKKLEEKSENKKGGAEEDEEEEEEVKETVSTTDNSSSSSKESELSGRKKYYQIAHAIKEKITQKPKALKCGDLRQYQMLGLEWLVSLYNNNLNGILADEMGLGKTVQTISLLAYVMEKKHNNGPFLVIVPMSTLHNNWVYEFTRWFPDCKKVVYDGEKEHRKLIREQQLFSGNYNVLLTTFEFAMRDKKYLKKVKWEYIIIDEAHRLKNPKCRLAQDLAQYDLHCRRVALTGTPLQNDLQELWALLNFLHPAIFKSCENFEKWFSSPFQNLGVGGGEKEQHTTMTEEEKLLVIDRLHGMLRPFMLRREKREVETQLANKMEKVLKCELTPLQVFLYKAILHGNIKMQNRMVQLRKVCNHPYLFHPYTRGVIGSEFYTFDENLVKCCGKFLLLDNILPKLKATGHRVLIFNQMTKLMNILEEYFNLREYKFLRLDGNTSAEDRRASLLAYNAPNSEYFIFMLSTKAGGLGLNLQSADTVILFDSDWNPQNDEQAMARAHRIGQTKQVIVLRLITAATVEEKILSTAYSKLDAEAMVIQAGMFHNKYKEEESRMMLEKVMHHGRSDETDVVNDEEVRAALARNDEELQVFRKMDASRKKHVLDTSNKLPAWLVDWFQNGSRARVSSQHLVSFNADHLFQSKDDQKQAVARKAKTSAHDSMPEIEDDDDESILGPSKKPKTVESGLNDSSKITIALPKVESSTGNLAKESKRANFEESPVSSKQWFKPGQTHLVVKMGGEVVSRIVLAPNPMKMTLKRIPKKSDVQILPKPETLPAVSCTPPAVVSVVSKSVSEDSSKKRKYSSEEDSDCEIDVVV